MTTLEPGILDAAISCLQESVGLTPDGHPDKPGYLNNLGNALQTRFSHLGGLDDLESAIVVKRKARKAVDLTPDSHPDKPACLNSLGTALVARFNRLGGLNDLESAIVVKRKAVDLTPDDHPHKPLYLNNIGNTLGTRFKRLGGLDDLESAMVVIRKAVDLTPDGHPDKPACLNNLGITIQTRFERLGGLDDLKSAIVVKRKAVDLTPDGHPDKPKCLNSLGNALVARFDRLGGLNDLESAIVVKHKAVDLTPDGHPDKPGCLNSLGITIHTRFGRLGGLDDLESAIVFKHHAVDLTPDGHPDKPGYLNNLGIALSTRFDRLGSLDDLESAIVVKCKAVDLTPDGHPDKPGCLNNLGSALKARFNRLGNLDDLKSAIAVKREAVDLTPDGHPDKPVRLNSLGIALQARFNRLGGLDDLESAIVVNRKAVDLTPDGHPDKPGQLNNLGIALEARFDRLGGLDDLESAIVVKRKAVDLTPDSHPDKPVYFNSLGTALKTRFDRLGGLDDLESAIVVKRKSVDLTPDGHPDKPKCLSNLGIALQARFNRLGGLNDLESAIVVKREAVDLTPDSHPDKPSQLNNLGSALQTRFSRLGSLDDLKSAIVDNHQAVNLTPDDDPRKPGQLVCLGRGYLHRYKTTLNPEDLKLAFNALMLAANQESGPPSDRFQAIKLCIFIRHLQILFGHAAYEDLMNDFDRAFSLIPQVAWLGTSISQRYTVLSSIGEVVSHAVAVAIQTGNLSRAIEWLDEGRSVVWGQLLQLRNPVDDLRSQHPDLADKLQSLSHNLEVAGHDRASGNNIRSGHMIVQDQVSVRVKLAQDYQDLLRHIREQDGFKNFLLPKTLAELIPLQRTDGPVIIINVHQVYDHGDALVVYGSAEPIIHVPLPKLTFKLAEGLRLCITQSLKKAGVRMREATEDRVADSGPPDDRGAFAYKFERSADSQIADVLEVLWLCIVQPILERIEGKLADSTITDTPHITWCPTGPLAFLPIHAAGIYGRRGMPGDGMKLSDTVVSSYTPTLSALLRPPHMFADGWPSMKALVVSQPDTPDMSKLPGVLSEVAQIEKHLGSQIKHLDDKGATVKAVLDAMNEDHCQVIHLACHGLQNTEDPTKSAFTLYDGNLTLSRLMSSKLRNAELAFLSACQTSTGDEKLPEEAVHLAAGMLAVGFKSVIGTMWSIGDQDAPIIADEVYRQLKENCVPGDGRLKTAYALHEAAKVLREKVGESNIVRWAPYVHFGI
ncbi:TPR-like protein [Vararia minispora EC-137]|uniref:TPR-like protein n=1 Tax=Vararia minispora EC-137 TaxID=1314806 RepID=A0ACB8Q9R0_9AGAM|nr:TPR-like protein [Vararia minispora EC-137]